MSFFLLIWSISSLAFIALASAMSKHQKQIFNRELNPAQSRVSASLGWLLLLTSLMICLFSGKISSMLSYWVGVLTFAALLIGLMLSYYSDKIKSLAYLLIGLTIITTGFLLF